MNTLMRAITAGKQLMNVKNRERFMDRFKRENVEEKCNYIIIQ